MHCCNKQRRTPKTAHLRNTILRPVVLWLVTRLTAAMHAQSRVQLWVWSATVGVVSNCGCGRQLWMWPTWSATVGVVSNCERAPFQSRLLFENGSEIGHSFAVTWLAGTHTRQMPNHGCLAAFVGRRTARRYRRIRHQRIFLKVS